MSEHIPHSVARSWVLSKIADMMKANMRKLFGGDGPATKLSPQDRDICLDIYLSMIDQFEKNDLSLEERLKYEIE
jgi:hypothetical protein